MRDDAWAGDPEMRGTQLAPTRRCATPMRAWLTGVGAMTLASAVLFSVVFELWYDGILKFQTRPELEFVGFPAYAFGAAVAVASGGWRGLFALVALSSLWIATVPFIPGADRDFFLRQLWNYGGIGLGALIAGVRPTRLISAAFIGAGVYRMAIAPNDVLQEVIVQPGLCQTDSAALCITVVQVLSVLLSLGAGAAAGLVVGRRMSFRDTTLLALTLALPSVMIVAHRGWTWQSDGLLSELEMASGVAAGLALVLAAAIARGTWAKRGRTRARV